MERAAEREVSVGNKEVDEAFREVVGASKSLLWDGGLREKLER